MPKQTSVKRWRCPAAARVKSFLEAALCALVAAVFLPRWLGIPVAVLAGGYGLGLAVLGASVTLDEAAGTLRLRVGLLRVRVRLADVTAVLVNENKVSLRRAGGRETSLHPWRKGPLDALLGFPSLAGEIGHEISRASAIARAYAADRVPVGAAAATDGGAAATTDGGAAAAGGGPATATPSGAGAPVVRDGDGAPGGGAATRVLADGGTPAATRSRLAALLLAGAGVITIAAALLVRVHWHNPVLTVLGVLIALGLGLTGLLQLLVALWIALTGRAPRVVGGRP